MYTLSQTTTRRPTFIREVGRCVCDLLMRWADRRRCVAVLLLRPNRSQLSGMDKERSGGVASSLRDASQTIQMHDITLIQLISVISLQPKKYLISMLALCITAVVLIRRIITKRIIDYDPVLHYMLQNMPTYLQHCTFLCVSSCGSGITQVAPTTS